MSEKKKPYTPPAVIDHGEIVEQTKGVVSYSWEVYGHQPPPIDDPY